MMPKSDSTETLSNLTLSELETLIEAIVQKNIKQKELTTSQTNQYKANYKSFEKTFNAWEDDKNEEEIIDIIYESRSVNFD